MDTRERKERQQEGRRRLRARRTRAGFLRGRVIAASLICFGLIWAVVFVQMATGNDPVLSAKPGAKATASQVSQPKRSPGRRETEVEAEPAPELEPEVAEPEFVEEPEPELEALATGQS